MVARQLVRECALITAEAPATEDNVSDAVVNLSHEVYVRYIMMEVTRYIRSVRNSNRLGPRPAETVLLANQTSGDARQIWIGEDHIGILHTHKIWSMVETASRPFLYL
jgi:hypothetical protein